ncbi:hypothetical protein BDDG_12448 [Blastomyces dermatitidis ATCC 18188]|uniref:Uncharacterized protein n=1 Tax=Ajellomyces dermatitidis (strain ATCC 18188 / CBS 674.68) TaxID=653446 RepID=A0A0J9EPH5_AJEDA|nr:hypothetical protein BDDG_12448 [Blastomyces dermatitidis ATCC 18188]
MARQIKARLNLPIGSLFLCFNELGSCTVRVGRVSCGITSLSTGKWFIKAHPDSLFISHSVLRRREFLAVIGGCFLFFSFRFIFSLPTIGGLEGMNLGRSCLIYVDVDVDAWVRAKKISFSISMTERPNALGMNFKDLFRWAFWHLLIIRTRDICMMYDEGTPEVQPSFLVLLSRRPPFRPCQPVCTGTVQRPEYIHNCK